MEVILKEDVAKLGSRGDVVKVAEGYGRNFLLPRKLAIEANRGNKAVIEQMKAARCAARPRRRRRPKHWPSSLKGVSVSFQRRYGRARSAVWIGHVERYRATRWTKKGFHVDRRKIQLHEPLKTVGEFTVPVKLHKDVTAHLKVVIEKEAAAE